MRHQACRQRSMPRLARLVQTNLSKLQKQHRRSFPEPKQNDRKSWYEYDELRTKVWRTAAKSKDRIRKELKWQSSVATRQRIQKQYPTKQKQMNKQFFGETTGQKQLAYVPRQETGQMLNDPAEVLEYIQSSFQKQARPASGSAKTGASGPSDENKKYSWNHDAYSSIDPFTLEIAAGKPGLATISLFRHVCDP